ncbi:hypothetical protein HNV10_15005 [Winogradskyella litoriviva]|uniref:Uncharacterized protein n=1 Tax=Winogradskyella litoriviva TaxID=1220182 RepID=A0ABX2E8Z2_9FLAO|nr:hypothetical protein [Winogradskyella litoriviva]NRD24561.1 hypothetical protein [Winogradskyella litoriviva]
MRNLIIKTIFILFTTYGLSAQAWMTNLEIAQSLASVENKMILMVWEETTKFQYPVFVNDDKGNVVFINNLFQDEEISPIIWKNFIPVIVSEYQYADLYEKIKGKRSQRYIDKFNDDTIKILDVNGNILNVNDTSEDLENITVMIQKYALNTEYIAIELNGYRQKKDFFTAYYLASKYLDFSMYMKDNVRDDIIRLSNIYLNEAYSFLNSEKKEDQLVLKQRVELLGIQQSLVAKRPKKVLRQLKRMDAEKVESSNQSFVAFLYYTAYKILKDETNAAVWESKISSVNLKKAQMIINLNKT